MYTIVAELLVSIVLCEHCNSTISFECTASKVEDATWYVNGLNFLLNEVQRASYVLLEDR